MDCTHTVPVIFTNAEGLIGKCVNLSFPKVSWQPIYLPPGSHFVQFPEVK